MTQADRARAVVLAAAMTMLPSGLVLGAAPARASSPGPASPAPGKGASPDRPATPGPPADRGPAPEFTLPDLRGLIVDSAYLSRPVTVVHFWATWCVPCMREIPEMNRLSARYEPAGVAIYAVAIGSGSAGDLRQIEKAFDIRHRVLVGDENVARAFGSIPAFPVTFLIDGRGRIVERHEGATREAHQRIEATLRGLLAEAGRPVPPAR